MPGFAQPLVALLEQPAGRDPAQPMIESAFAAAALDWRHLTIEVVPERLPGAVEGLRALGFAGANVAAVHERTVCAHLDELTPSARMIGAVDCIVRDEERLIGHSTAGRGLVEAIRTRRPVRGAHVQVLASGGASGAVALELVLAGASRITLVDRDPARGREVEGHSREAGGECTLVPWDGPARLAPELDVLLHLAPAGSGAFGEAGADEARPDVDLSALESRTLVGDTVLAPDETWLLREARSRDCEIVDGREILVRQRVIAFELWTKRTADPTALRDALTQHLEDAEGSAS